MRLAGATASGLEGSFPLTIETRAGRNAKHVMVAFWTVILGLLLRHREVISSDTLSNYIHVWFVADHLWHGQGLPFHMPVLAHGQALAFPYGFIPWMFAVLLWPLMGEWSVTLTLGIGFVGLVLATFWAFPELRRGWWAAAVLVNPAFAEGLMLGQLPFLWAAAMLMIAIGCWRRYRRTAAIVLAALAQITHAPVLMPLTALAVLWWWRYGPETERRALVRSWLISVAFALPAAALVFASPVTAHSSPLYSLWIEVETVALRSLVLLVPIALVYLQRRDVTNRAPMYAVAFMVVGQIVTMPISGMGVGWGAVNRLPDPVAAGIPHSTDFVRGATYRVLTQGDGKYGQYAVVRAGGRLDSEFFPESLYRRSFRDEAAYARFLTDRQVDFVVLDPRYQKFKTNEEELLDDMVAASASGRCVGGLQVQRSRANGALAVYDVSRNCS